MVYQLCLHPLGRQPQGKARKILDTLIVFALCGLWHGARWTYVLWGLYAAFWLCVESLLDINRRFDSEWDNPLGRTARRCIMFRIFVPAALLFRADSLEQLSVIFPRLFTEMGYACVNLDAVPEDQRGNAAAVEQAFRDAVAAMEGVTLAGELEDYVYQNEDFYDTNYHLRSSAAARNTDLWIRDLTAQLDGEGTS